MAVYTVHCENIATAALQFETLGVLFCVCNLKLEGVPQQAVDLEKVYQKEKVLAHLGLSWELCYKYERKIW